MSPASPIELTLSAWWFLGIGVTVDDGDHDEPQGTRAPADIGGFGERRRLLADAAALMGVVRRQAYRRLSALRSQGADGVISRRRGKPSNRADGSIFRRTVLELVREHYADFGPTLAAEKVAERHGLPIGVESLRQWMVAAGFWVRRRDRGQRVHQPRSCWDCLGELVLTCPRRSGLPVT
jgi:hypothetical protein